MLARKRIQSKSLRIERIRICIAIETRRKCVRCVKRFQAAAEREQHTLVIKRVETQHAEIS